MYRFPMAQTGRLALRNRAIYGWHEAGWTNVQIGKLFNLSAQRIGQILSNPMSKHPIQ